jgi:hypothetical protein
MKVSELIKLLSAMPQDLVVLHIMFDDGYSYSVTNPENVRISEYEDWNDGTEYPCVLIGEDIV